MAFPYDGATWNKSDGEDQYRRAIYTYWKRTSPYPSMISFDGVAREVCLAQEDPHQYTVTVPYNTKW